MITSANPFAAYASGQQMGQQMQETRRQNALLDLYRDQGAGIAAGDKNALAALAQFDPMAARQITRQSEADALQREQFDYRKNRDAKADARADRAFEMRVKEFERTASREEKAAALAEAEQAVAIMSTAQTPEEWDALAQKYDAPQYVGKFEDREAIQAQFMTLAEVLKGQEGAKPLSGPGKVQADIDAGILPAGTELRSPQVVVNTGDNRQERPIVDKPPKGFQRVWDEPSQSYVDKPIPGSDVDADRAGASRAGELAAADYARKADIVNSNIDKALSELKENGRWVAGWGSILAGIPESGARDFQATIDTIKANLGFEELQAMRDSSPTGGALGQVTEREIAFLQAIQGNLDTAQSPEQLADILTEIKTRRAEFAAERERIRKQNFTATNAAGLEETVRGIPDFGSMSDAELDAYIQENSQ